MRHFAPYQTTFVDRFILCVAVVSAIFIAAITFGCKDQPYSDSTPAIQKKVDEAATRAAGIGNKITSASGNVNAAANKITDGRGKIFSVYNNKPPAELAPALVDFSDAFNFLIGPGKASEELAAAKAENDILVADLNSASADLGSQIEANGKLVADNDALKKKYEALQDDWLGPAFWRLVNRITLTTIIIVGTLIIAVGVLGVMYGADKVTKPIAGIFGTILGWAQYLFYQAGTFILSAVPVVGHWLDEWAYAAKNKKAESTGSKASVSPAPTTPTI